MVFRYTLAMRAFKVYLNGKRLCVAGIGDDGVLSAHVTSVVGRGRDELWLHVGGLISPKDEHVRWQQHRWLREGDEVRIKVVETGVVDKPRKRYRPDPRKELVAQKRYVREMAKKFGWKIQTGRKSN